MRNKSREENNSFHFCNVLFSGTAILSFFVSLSVVECRLAITGDMKNIPIFHCFWVLIYSKLIILVSSLVNMIGFPNQNITGIFFLSFQIEWSRSVWSVIKKKTWQIQFYQYQLDLIVLNYWLIFSKRTSHCAEATIIYLWLSTIKFL